MEWKPKAANLDEIQRQIIRDCVNGIQNSGEVFQIPWISGFAGNGKSVVLVHIMEQLADLDNKASIAFITYTHALKDLIATSILTRFKTRITVQTHTNFINEKLSYDYVFVDEVQDISENHLQKIRDLSGGLVLAGDFAQSIYPDNKPITPNKLKSSFNVVEHRLLKMYRLTKRLADIVIKLLPAGLFTMGEPNPLSEEVPPRLYKFPRENEQFKWVWENAVSYSQPRSPSVILFPFHKDIESFVDFVSTSEGFGHAPRRASYKKGQGRVDPYQEINEFFLEKDLRALLQVLGNGSGSSAISISSSRKVVFLMTYHSAKGLDFDTVFVPSLDSGKKLYPGRDMLNQDSDIENKLLFVALTRSKKFLFMSYVGDKPHDLIQVLNIQVTQQNLQENTY